jgi:peroxiredoxin (alkyl hydroperoxide reductase subunit C)
MVRVGFAAPTFDCLAVVHGSLVPFHWPRAPENRPRVLPFDSLGRTAHSPDYLITLGDAVEGRLHAELAVVCRDPLYEVLAWADRRGAGARGSLPFPLIVDSDDRVAWLYDLMAEDGRVLWGRFVIDPRGIVRQMAVSCFPVEVSVEDLVRSVQASRLPVGRGPWN